LTEILAEKYFFSLNFVCFLVSYFVAGNYQLKILIGMNKINMRLKSLNK